MRLVEKIAVLEKELERQAKVLDHLLSTTHSINHTQTFIVNVLDGHFKFEKIRLPKTKKETK